MTYNIVLTTAEDVVAVVDAVVAKGSGAKKNYITEFTGIATEDQVNKALQMAIELQLLKYDSLNDCYEVDSFLASKIVSVASDEQKAVFMRLVLEQYAPYNTFKTRYEFTKSIELACRQTKILHSMSSNERDIKNTYEYINAPIMRTPDSKISLTEKGQALVEEYEGNQRNERLVERSLTITKIAMWAAIANAVAALASLIKMFF